MGSASDVTPMFWGAAADVPPLLGPAGVAHMSIQDFAKWAGWNAGEGKRGPGARQAGDARAHSQGSM